MARRAIPLQAAHRFRVIVPKGARPYLWFIPATVIVGGVLFYPLIWSFVLSFFSWSLIRPERINLVGVSNYLKVFSDPLFILSLKHTAMFLFASVSLQFFWGFGLALILDTDIRGKNFFLTGLILPYVLSPVMAGIMWRVLLHEEWGIANFLLTVVGLPSVNWLSDPGTTLWTIVMVDVWQHVPFTLLIIWAGLQAIPEELREAAQIDGANALQRLFYVTIPYLRALIVLVLTFRTIFGIRTFDIVDVLYPSGGPGNAATLLGPHLNRVLKSTWAIGEASAISYVMLLITLTLSISIWMFGRQKDNT